MLKSVVAGVVAGCLGAGAVSLAHAQAGSVPDDISQEELIAKAKEEGRLTWYVSVPTPGSQAAAEAFMELYPEIQVDIQRLGGFGLWERLSSEFAANVHNVDVYSQADFGVRNDAAERGIIAPYIPPNARDYDPQFLDPDGFGFATRIVPSAIAYNTDLVSEEDAPKTWNDLLDPMWAGQKIGISDPRASGFTSSAFWKMTKSPAIGEEYFEKLKEQDPLVYEDSGQQINSLVSGEIPIVVLLDYRPWEFMEAGAPVKVVYPEEGVGWGMDYTHLAAQAPHPYAARLFMDFYASEEGTRAVAENLRTYVAMPGIGTYPEGYGRPALEELNLLPGDLQEQTADYDRFTEWFASIFD